jgi:hypothetical protein
VQWNDVDAIDRAGRHAKFASRAVFLDDGVHQLIGADDRVHRAGANAERAADATRFIDQRKLCAFHACNSPRARAIARTHSAINPGPKAEAVAP